MASSKNSNKKQSVALSSVFASAGLTIMKLIVGILSGSIGIISEAAHSALDLMAATLTFFAVKAGDKPADERHHYGHGKVESVSALIETALLFVTSAWIIYEAIQRLMTKTVEVETTWYTFAVIAVSIVVDFSRSKALKKVAEETRSQALEADALHFSSDILTSLVVFIGLVFVAFGIQSADAYAAIGVSIFVAYAGWKLGKKTMDILVDAAPEGLKEKIVQAAGKVKGVINIEQVRVKPLGSHVFVDMVVTVNRKLPLVKANEIADEAVNAVRKVVPETDIIIHTRPLTLDSETLVEQVQIAAARHNLQANKIIIHEQEGKKYISYELELDENLKLENAHEIATRLEKTIRDEIGNDVEISTHIEPLRGIVIRGHKVTPAEEIEIKKTVLNISEESKQVKNVHKILARKERGKLFISLHCVMGRDVSIRQAHRAASQLEESILKKIPETEQVVVHTEPSGKSGYDCH